MLMVGVAGTGLVPNAKGVLARIPQARELATQAAALLLEPLQIPGEPSQHALQINAQQNHCERKDFFVLKHCAALTHWDLHV
eukprot:scaffold39221_cov22-Prasinocladus_malaysianus.AAC.1